MSVVEVPQTETEVPTTYSEILTDAEGPGVYLRVHPGPRDRGADRGRLRPGGERDRRVGSSGAADGRPGREEGGGWLALRAHVRHVRREEGGVGEARREEG